MAKHILVAYVEDKPGVLNRVASLFRRRAFNIDSLTVGRTADISVFSVDLLTAPFDQIAKAHAVMTIVGGKVVYEAAR